MFFQLRNVTVKTLKKTKFDRIKWQTNAVPQKEVTSLITFTGGKLWGVFPYINSSSCRRKEKANVVQRYFMGFEVPIIIFTW